MKRTSRILIVSSQIVIALLVLLAGDFHSVRLQAADWPAWRHDGGHGAYTPAELPEELHLQWVREFSQPRPAWPGSQEKLQFDAGYEPVVVGQKMFVGSTVNDSITAYDTRRGEELWKFYTDGPVRFAPVANEKSVYAVSDDGHLYSLSVDDGTLNWRVNGGPGTRWVIGNERLVSTWPARGGPVLHDSTVYFAASIWPSMGIFIHGVDAETGKLKWTNENTGSKFVVHPHGSPAFGSIVPQGHLAISGDHLIVPGGRSSPAIFDLKTGELDYFEYDKRMGHHLVMAAGPYYFVDNGRYQLKEEGEYAGTAYPDVVTEDLVISSVTDEIKAESIDGELKRSIKKDRKGRPIFETAFVADTQWSFRPDGEMPSKVRMVAGDSVFTSGKGKVARFDISAKPQEGEKLAANWSTEIDGDAWSILAADDRLFVVSDTAKIYCYGAEKTSAQKHELAEKQPANNDKDVLAVTQNILNQTKAKDGYGIVWGLSDAEIVFDLVDQTEMKWVVVDPDAERVDAFRKEAEGRGVYGMRVSALVADVATSAFPMYMAHVAVCLDPERVGLDDSAESFQTLYQSLRPYGGTAYINWTGSLDELNQKAAGFELANGMVSSGGDGVALIRRVGALPDSGSWSHQYGDAGNSVVSQDGVAKAPLGVLWFGGPSHDGILPRHGHGPSPQVAGGRLVIEGPDLLRSVDVYTGRVVWERDLKGIGDYYNVTSHFAGAGEIGSNYVTLADKVYAVYGSEILELDAATGETAKTFSLSENKEADGVPFGYLGVLDDYLVATTNPVKVDDADPDKKSDGDDKASDDGKTEEKSDSEDTKTADIDEVLTPTRYSSSSRKIVVFNRKTGKLLWSRDAEYNFRHNCIAAAAGKLFCIDGISPFKLRLLERRGVKAEAKAQLLALDIATGDVVWSTDEDVFGTFLSYSVEHDLLLQSGSANRDRAKDEVGIGMAVYNGTTGNVLWKDLELAHGGPCLLWKDKIITNGASGFQLDLFTGKKTGWTFSRTYGCNTVVGSQNLLTFRSAAAGFCDLAQDSGTGNLGGFRSSCTANLIAADGVLNAPDYTRTCTCAYQNQASLAFVHMPDAELWTFNDIQFEEDLIEQVGINLGAPGDRREEDGTLWIEYPVVGGPSPSINIKTEPAKPEWFQIHTTRMEEGQNDALKWVAASGVKGLQSIQIRLKKSEDQSQDYTVRLHFAEPDDIEAGQRVFGVQLQGETVLDRFDIVKEAGGPRQAIVREFKGVPVQDLLEVQLVPENAESEHPPVLCGIEMRLEKQEK